MRGVTKRFPGVVANDDVSFEVARGEVHALLGENGAGKTTLMNVLTGLYRPDEGEIEVGGRLVELHSPRDAIEAGIGMVHQHFRLVETLTAFGQYTGVLHDMLLYIVDNEIHHRGQGYVYLRALGIEPPPFYVRE